jgi:hypothetical protein
MSYTEFKKEIDAVGKLANENFVEVVNYINTLRTMLECEFGEEISVDTQSVPQYANTKNLHHALEARFIEDIEEWNGNNPNVFDSDITSEKLYEFGLDMWGVGMDRAIAHFYGDDGTTTAEILRAGREASHIATKETKRPPKCHCTRKPNAREGIKAYLDRRGITVAQLAEMVYMGRDELESQLNNSHEMPMHTYMFICRVLEESPDAFVIPAT